MQIKISKTWLKKLTLMVLAFIISGCTANGPIFKQADSIPSDKALIYIYRPAVIHGAALSPSININNEISFPLVNGGYFPYFAAPGNIKVSITQTSSNSVTINAKAGETYYVKGGTITMAFGIPFIKIMSHDTGLAEIKECKRLPDVTQVSTGL